MSLEILTDEELMLMYQTGTEKAFQVLYARHSSKVYGFLKRRLATEEKVTDVYQEVFLKIHRSKHLYNKSLPALPWIFTITKSVLLDAFKKDKNFKYADGFDFDKIEVDPSDKNDFFEGTALAVSNLPDAQRTAVQMRYIENKTFDEIAESLKTSPANVRQIVSRGIKRLKELLSEGDQS